MCGLPSGALPVAMAHDSCRPGPFVGLSDYDCAPTTTIGRYVFVMHVSRAPTMSPYAPVLALLACHSRRSFGSNAVASCANVERPDAPPIGFVLDAVERGFRAPNVGCPPPRELGDTTHHENILETVALAVGGSS
jgi:hypothetical protein